jgi:hypothetical protein
MKYCIAAIIAAGVLSAGTALAQQTATDQAAPEAVQPESTEASEAVGASTPTARERLSELADRVKLQQLNLDRSIPYLILSLFLVFFGAKIYKVAVILFMASVFGQIGGWIAQAIDANALVYTFVAASVGALLALPLEIVVRTIIGAAAGVGIAFIAGTMAAVNLQTLLTVCALGFAAGAAVTFLFRRLTLIVGFSVWGAFLAMHSVMSIYQGRAQGEMLVVTDKALIGMLITAVVGVIFQYMLETEEGTDIDDDGLPDD